MNNIKPYMKMNNYILQVLILFTSCMQFASCEHKDLCYEHSHAVKVKVVFDWSKAPGVTPETMRLYMFTQDGNRPELYEFTDSRGGYINIPAGRYKALCINSDTESILYRNIERFGSFEAYTPDAILSVRSFRISRVKGSSEEHVVNAPDILYSDRLDDITVELKEDQTITMFPELSVYRYHVKIKNVANLKYISQDGISGAITSMSGSFLVGLNELTNVPVTIPFEVNSDGVSVLKTDFLVFGSVGSSQQLVVYVIMTDGSKLSYTFDVGGIIKSQLNSGNRDIYIELDGLRLPKPIVNGGGFHPAVDDWENIEIDIPM